MMPDLPNVDIERDIQGFTVILQIYNNLFFDVLSNCTVYVILLLLNLPNGIQRIYFNCIIFSYKYNTQIFAFR